MRRAASCSAARRDGLRPLGQAQRGARRIRPRRSGHAPRRGWRRCGRPAPAACAPAAIPAARSWRPCSRLSTSVSGDHVAEQPLHQRLRRLEAAVEEDGADQRLHRVGQDRRALGAAAASSRLRTGASPRAGRATAPRGAGCPRAPGGPARGSGRPRRCPEALVQQAETAVLSTASPRNSSRSLCSALKLRCVSARRSSFRCVKRYPRRCCSARGAHSMASYFERPSYLISRYTGPTGALPCCRRRRSRPCRSPS